MAFVNLTPHAVVIVGLTKVPRSGTFARCATSTSPAGEVDGVKLFRTEYGAIEIVDAETKEILRLGLPDPVPGVILIVSALVRAAVPHRTDVASPGDQVRDEAGNVIGCRHLIVS